MKKVTIKDLDDCRVELAVNNKVPRELVMPKPNEPTLDEMLKYMRDRFFDAIPELKQFIDEENKDGHKSS